MVILKINIIFGDAEYLFQEVIAYVLFCTRNEYRIPHSLESVPDNSKEWHRSESYIILSSNEENAKYFLQIMQSFKSSTET